MCYLLNKQAEYSVCTGQSAVESANASVIKADNERLKAENKELTKKLADAVAELKVKDQLTTATVKAAVATAEKAMEQAAHNQFREGMVYAQQFTAQSRQMV